MSKHDATLLDFIRHGEPVGGRRYRGNGIDDPLSELGWQQLRDTTAKLDGWQQIVSSPMRRCTEFAHWLADQRGLPLEIQDDLREVGFGDWEGNGRDQLREERGEEYRAFYKNPVTNRPKGAEPLVAFGARVGAVFEHLLQAHAGKHLLVVAHAGVIRAALAHVTGVPAVRWYSTLVDNAGLTRFAKDDHGLRLITHNWRPSL